MMLTMLVRMLILKLDSPVILKSLMTVFINVIKVELKVGTIIKAEYFTEIGVKKSSDVLVMPQQHVSNGTKLA